MCLCVSHKIVEIHDCFTNFGRGEFEQGSRKVRAGFEESNFAILFTSFHFLCCLKCFSLFDVNFDVFTLF